MDKIEKGIKCVNCRNILDSPVLLPCGCSICHNHILNQTGPTVLCSLCEIEHPLPPNRTFPPNKALARIVKAQIGTLDFGLEHSATKQSCTRLNDLLTDFEYLLKDPFNFSYEAIEYLKHVAQLKVEEKKLKLDEELSIVIGKLDEFKASCKDNLKSNEYLAKSEIFEKRKEVTRQKLEKWTATLNELKVNESEWDRIKSECEKYIERIEIELEKLKRESLIPKRFETHRVEVENKFGKFEIDATFKFR
jgi:hypothetical protein